MRSNRYGDQRQIIFAASDITTQIVSPTKRFFVIVNPLVGIATLFCMVLPDARTIRLGTPFVFENQSSNFVGIYNADRTTFHRLPPRATLTCVLTTQASASGTWHSVVHDPAVGNPAFGYSNYNDFVVATLAGGDPAFVGVVSGTGAYCGPGNYGVSDGRQGTIHTEVGTTTTGYSLLYAGSTLNVAYLGAGCRAVTSKQSVGALSTVAEEYISRAGFGDNVTGGAHTEGAYFLYDRVTAGIVNWQMKTIKTAGGAATTQTDTGVAVTASLTVYQKLRVEINSTASRADFFINNVQVSAAGGLGNIPSVTTNIKLANVGMTKSAGTTNRYNLVDYIWVQAYPTTPR